MSSDTIPHLHPVTRCVQEVAAALESALEADPRCLAVEAKREALL